MSRLAVLVVAGCASAPLKPAVSLETPIAACGPADATRPEPARSELREPTRIDRARRDEVRRELAAIEAEVDALDDEIAAGALASGPSRDDALAAAGQRIAFVGNLTLDNMHPDASRQLRRLALSYFDLRADQIKLEHDLGPKHLDLVEAKHKVERVRAAFDRQRDVEREHAHAWYDELAKLPARATPARVRQARLRALARVVDRFAPDGVAPAEAPAVLRVAVDRAADIASELDELAPYLGPKHPDMIRLRIERDEAVDAIKSAVAAADDQIAREIAQLDAPRTPPAIDGGKLVKRAELAARARDLRRELDALSP